MRYQLSSPQLQFYRMDKVAKGSATTITGSVLSDGNGNRNSIMSAIRKLYAINDALRLRIIDSEMYPYQEVVQENYYSVIEECMTFQTKAEMHEFAEKLAKERISLQGSLCRIIGIRIKNDHFGVMIHYHHIIGDALSSVLIGKQFFELYRNIENGLEEKKKVNSFLSCISNLELYRKSENYIHDREYWLKEYQLALTIPKMKYKWDTFNGKRYFIEVEQETAQILKRMCEKHNLSLYEVFSTAVCIYQCRRNRTNICSLGTKVSNRKTVMEKQTVGVFSNALPLFLKFDLNSSFIECVDQLHIKKNEVAQHQNYNYLDVKREFPKEDSNHLSLFDIYVSYQEIDMEGYDTHWYFSGQQLIPMKITIGKYYQHNSYLFIYDYMLDVMDEHRIEAFHKLMMEIIMKGLK